MPRRRSGAQALSSRLAPRRVVLPLLALAAGLTLSSCGSSTRKASTARVPRLTRRSPAVQGAPRAGPGTPVGTTRRVPATGTVLVVKVTKVIDPLRGSGAKVPAGMEPVAVLITARNAGPNPYDSSATSDFSLLSAAGHATPVYAPAGVCQTYVQDFMNELGTGQTRTGCIAYLLPRGYAPTTVRFSPDGGSGGHAVSWVVR